MQAEDEFNKAQNVFEELNKELREELPVLYQRYVVEQHVHGRRSSEARIELGFSPTPTEQYLFI